MRPLDFRNPLGKELCDGPRFGARSKVHPCLATLPLRAAVAVGRVPRDVLTSLIRPRFSLA